MAIHNPLTRLFGVVLFLSLATALPAAFAKEAADLSNPNIDMPGYLQVSADAAAYRENHRISEEDFSRMSREPGTLVLDARSKDKFDLLHVRGAVHLSFTDFTAASLAQILPDPNTRVLIYCNNNFRNAERAFPSKMARASLNLSTYIALYTYGYRNIYELAPLIDISASKIPMESSAPGTKAALGSR